MFLGNTKLIRYCFDNNLKLLKAIGSIFFKGIEVLKTEFHIVVNNSKYFYFLLMNICILQTIQ